MNTRSKTKLNNNLLIPPNDIDSSSDSSIDENGNIKNLIDDSELNHKNNNKAIKDLNLLINNQNKKKLNRNKKIDNINQLFLSYLILNATEKTNQKIKKNKNKKIKKKKKKIKNKNKNKNKIIIEETDSDSDNSLFNQLKSKK